MSKPLTKPRSLLLRMTDAQHAALTVMADGSPLGPSIVAAALGTPRPIERSPLPAVPLPVPVAGLTAAQHVAALETWAVGLDRRSTSKSPALLALATLARLVRDA